MGACAGSEAGSSTYLARLPDLDLIFGRRRERLEDWYAGRLADRPERFSAFVPHHDVIGGVEEDLLQCSARCLRLHLAEHERNLVAKQRRVLSRAILGGDELGFERLAENLHSLVGAGRAEVVTVCAGRPATPSEQGGHSSPQPTQLSPA